MDHSQITTMTRSGLWNNKLIIASTTTNDPKTKFELYATGEADMNGRTYIAIPVNTNITHELKQKYNLL